MPHYCVSLAVLGCLLPISGAADERLGKPYQEFLSGPVSYLITKAERQAFGNLKTDSERDSFMERFWEVRNPAPGSGQNDFREEYYRRVAWANAQYGNDAGSDGWRTDRGRTYILFGRPQTSSSWVGQQELYPIELWFYANPGLTELPPFFYVLFCDKDGIGGYRFYHPWIDGPDKLIRGTAGGTKESAYRYLRSISAELAAASLSFIPGEPADTETYSGSMASASILRGIQAYSQMPSYVAAMSERSQRLARVTSRVEFDLARTNLLVFAAREKGEAWLHWQLQVHDPKQPKVAGGRVRYDVAARLYSGGKLVYERSDAPGFAVPAGGAEELNRKPFIYEARMPVVEGRYKLTVTAHNPAAGKTYEASRDFAVLNDAGQGLLSEIVVVSKIERDHRARPFQFGGVKFTPSPTGEAATGAGLRIFYELILPDPRPEELTVEYVIGGVANKLRKTFEDKIDAKLADEFRSLFTSKTLPLDGLPPGSYQLALRVKNTRTGAVIANSAPFHLTAGGESAPPVTISQGQADTPQWIAATQYERALCWLAQDRRGEAISALQASWESSRSPAVHQLLQKLQQRPPESSRARQTQGKGFQDE
jgi:GWxTD domain-containing protein